MTQLLLRLFFNAIALLIITHLVPGFHVANIYTALIVALLIGLLNAFIKPILLILTLPITILSFGLFALVLNIVLFWFVSVFVKGFTIENLNAAVIGWLLYTIFGLAINIFLEREQKV